MACLDSPVDNQFLHRIFIEEKSKFLNTCTNDPGGSGVDDSSSFINFARAAVLNADKGTLKKLLDSQPNIINASDSLGRTLLIYAASSNKPKILKLLLKYGCNVNACDKSGRSALHWAVHWDNLDIVKFLLQQSASCCLSDAEGVTPVHLAVKNSSTKCLRILLDFMSKKDKLLHFTFLDKRNRSELHWAAALCHFEHLQLLLKTAGFSSSVDKRDKDGHTPLMLSVLSPNSENSLACCQLLVEKAHWIVKMHDNNGLSVLHHACSRGNGAVVQWLLENSFFDAFSSLDDQFRTPLHHACLSDSVPCVDTLLAHGADLQRDKTGSTPLHYAAKRNSEVLVEKLLIKFKRDDILDVHGRTALMHAVVAGSNDVIDVFFRLIQVDKKQQDFDGRSLLHLAAKSGQCQTLQILLKYNLPEMVDIYGLTPFLSAVEHGQVRCVQTLLKAGAETSRCDRHGRTALHWAALGGHAYLCQFLIKHDLNPDFADSGGRTPLHCAAFAGHSDCVSVFLQAGTTTVWSPDNDGYSALHTAAEQGHMKTVKILIEDSGLAVNSICTIDDHERTPLDLALSSNHTELAEYLFSLGGLTYESLSNAAATKIQAFYRSYLVRKMMRCFYRPNKY